MTIAATYLTAEGVVFGADSTTTISVSQGVGQLLNHAQKIFEIGEPGDGRLALCTWGSASIGEVSHRSMAARLADRTTNAMTVEQVADTLCDLMKQERDRQGTGRIGDFGYSLGGIDLDLRLPRAFKLAFVDGEQAERSQLGWGEAMFEGAPQFFTRTFHGCDPDLPDLLIQGLKRELSGLVPDDKVEDAFIKALDQALPRIASAGFRNLPLREAIDFVHMYLHVTVKGFKFRFGPPVCGGPLEIAFISSDRPFRWARHKPFDAAILEVEAGAWLTE